MKKLDSEALAHNEKPFILSFFPSGMGVKPQPSVVIDDSAVQLVAFKKEENGEGYIVRLYNSIGERRQTTITITCLGMSQRTEMQGFEIKSLKLNMDKRTFEEVDILENSLWE